MIPTYGQPILTTAAMARAEAVKGADAAELMRRAGKAVAEQIRRLAMGADVLVLCGPGNNGGDGYIAAAALAGAGGPVRVAALGEPKSGPAAEARACWTGQVEPLADILSAPILVDALFGTGLSRPLDASVLASLARLHAAAQLTIAVDLPSGVAADDGSCLSDIPCFDLTLALGALKPAHALQPAAARAGMVRILPIGIAAPDIVAALAPPALRAPSADAHKYSRGLVAVVAGIMPGAAALAATAAARAGAGYVLLLGSATDRLPHAIVRRRYDPAALGDPRIGALLIGPGLGRGDAARGKLAAALATPHPLIVDGDALHLIDPDRLATRTASTILTPHAGEFAALFGDTGGSKIDRTCTAARLVGATVIFKGADTVIAHPDGRARVAIDAPTWLSTAGTGDTLAGIVAARLASGDDSFLAACEGVWLHAEVARRAGPAFIADDLANAIASAVAGRLSP